MIVEIDKTPVLKKDEEKLAEKPPARYRVDAVTNNRVCAAKFSLVVDEVFDISMVVGIMLAIALEVKKQVSCGVNMTHEVAEMKAHQANKSMTALVGNCQCGHQVSFEVIKEDES